MTLKKKQAGNLKSSDPLEQTEEADDISGENNCPMHLRITAIHKLGESERITFQNGDGRKLPIGKGNQNEDKKLKIWAMLGGEVIDLTSDNIHVMLGVTWKAIISAKSRAVIKDRTSTEALVCGNRFGWGNRPDE